MRNESGMTAAKWFGHWAWVGVLSLAMAGTAGAARIGPGSAFSTTGTDSGDRLNVATRAADITAVAPGTYNVQNFSYTSTGAGAVTPFLAVQTNGTAGSKSYNTVWVGPTLTGTASGVQTAAYTAGTQTYTLTTVSNLYAGFFTTGGRVAFLDGQPAGSTDHDATPTNPTGANQVVNGFSNENLGRVYAFEVNAATPEPAAAGLLVGFAALGLAARRRRA